MKTVEQISTGRLKAILKDKQPGRYADGGGLYLVVERRGSCYWVLRIRANGRRRDFGLGSVEYTMIAQARQKAREFREKVRAGQDPGTRGKLKPAAVPTFKKAATDCIVEHIKGLTNKKAKAQWTNTLNKYAYPHIGNMPVDQVGQREVLKTLSPIWAHRQETARRLRQRIEKVLDWAKAHGLRSGDNPASKAVLKNVLPAQTKSVKHHAALPFKEVGKFVADLRESPAETVTKLAFEFMILTASRVGEVVGARWIEMDFEARTWTIPAERMKAKRPHIVPLSERALAILIEAKTLNGSDYVFPSPAKKREPLSTGAFDKRIDEAGLTGNATAHGFRSCFRDWCGENGISRDVAEAALAHAIKDKTEAAYHRTHYLEARRSVMQAWSNYVIGRAATADNVLPMRMAQ